MYRHNLLAKQKNGLFSIFKNAGRIPTPPLQFFIIYTFIYFHVKDFCVSLVVRFSVIQLKFFIFSSREEKGSGHIRIHNRSNLIQIKARQRLRLVERKNRRK